MKLQRFRVTNFRSVVDSGWIETDDVCALIGTNESGKTNLLLPLWKLNPAKGGEIDLLSDMPRKQYNTMREKAATTTFIEASFEPSAEEAAQMAARSGLPASEFSVMKVERRFDGGYYTSFPEASAVKTASSSKLGKILVNANRDLEALTIKDEQKAARDLAVQAVAKANTALGAADEVKAKTVDELLKALEDAGVKDATIAPILAEAVEAVRKIRTPLGPVHPVDDGEFRTYARGLMPKFVYYSNYGNLDSEIYLPHVIENMQRKGMGQKEEAKARTLKVLFEFVRLKPTEILDLGRTFRTDNTNRRPTDAELDDIAKKTKERRVLLDSASSDLTAKFKAWWKQGDYVFRFDADGDHFRIWVSDTRRPEQIELENRSTGLQWFLSFFLVFLVERADAHENAILLLDEPGLSLHPIAQRNLSEFFNSLAQDNQLIYTTHSPFLVDADYLDRVRKVYVSEDGSTKATADLGAADPAQRNSGYAVHAALGLTIAESLLIGCTPVLVEGASDQIYLTAMKHALATTRKFTTGKEIVFPPCGGVKGVKPIVAILGGKDGELPRVLLDSDKAGRDFAESMRKNLYAAASEKLLDVQSFTGIAESEIEDLVPVHLFAREVDRVFKGANTAFADVVTDGKPVVPQVEAWAATEKIDLLLGWKVEVARKVKQSLITKPIADEKLLDQWQALFTKLAEA